MASQYFAILTDYGTRAIAQALSQGQPLQLAKFAVGDGNGQAVTPTASATVLVHQTHIAPVSAVSLDPRNNKQVIVELTIPENVGGFYIREMGVFDAQNKLIAYANCPESFKPTESSGSGKVQVLRMILKVESSSAVTLSIDNSVIFVTRQQMAPKTITATTQNGFDESGHSHEIAKANTTQQGIVQLTNDTGLESESLALTAKAGKKLAQQTAQLQLNVSQNYIQYSKKSSAVNSESEDNLATSKAAKIAYDKGIEAKTAADNAKRTADSKQSPATTLAGYGIGNFKIENFVGNVNTLQTDGIYAVTQASRSQNLPVAGNGCHIQVIAGGDGRWCRQIAYIAYSTDMYERHQTSSETDSWSAWARIDVRDEFNALKDIFIGVPIPYPLSTVPTGCLAMNGQRFDTRRYPKLAQKYPSGQLPDMRGEFIRGLDNGRGVDAGREMLSWQRDAMRNFRAQFTTVDMADDQANIISGVSISKTRWESGWFAKNDVGRGIYNYKIAEHMIDIEVARAVPTADENRPRNIAYHYICLAE